VDEVLLQQLLETTRHTRHNGIGWCHTDLDVLYERRVELINALHSHTSDDLQNKNAGSKHANKSWRAGFTFLNKKLEPS
jgi:hypothetical protein